MIEAREESDAGKGFLATARALGSLAFAGRRLCGDRRFGSAPSARSKRAERVALIDLGAVHPDGTRALRGVLAENDLAASELAVRGWVDRLEADMRARWEELDQGERESLGDARALCLFHATRYADARTHGLATGGAS